MPLLTSDMADFPFYFAYGSNMNAARMRARGLDFEHAERAELSGFALRFNKRAHNKSGIGYANIHYSPGSVVEGVLYALTDIGGLARMDRFEGTPVRYSRDLFPVTSASGLRHAWVYVANPAYVEANLAVEENYLEHLLAAAPLLSPAYVDRLRLTPVLAATVEDDSGRGLLFNV